MKLHNLIGYFYRDQFGRIYVDKCMSNEEHLKKNPNPGFERTNCRKYVEDIFAEFVDTGQFKSIELFIHNLPYFMDGL